MTEEWLDQKIKEAHENAVEKGFYECRECKGNGLSEHGRWCRDNGKMVKLQKCQICNGKKIYRNIGELLMLIITELSEAVEAHRKNKFADIDRVDSCMLVLKNNPKHYPICFKEVIKDTFEDELADTFIRLFDLCGYLKLKITGIFRFNANFSKDNVAEDLFCMCGLLHQSFELYLNEGNMTMKIIEALTWLNSFCIDKNIDIKKHIDLKMAYNKTRPHKHGKEY